MSIHITIVGFGKMPDTSLETRLSHCGFLGDGVAGEIIQGETAAYTVKTQYGDSVNILHVAILDQRIDCRDLALVYEKPFDGITVDTPEATARAELMGWLLAETAGRCGSTELMREVEGLFEDPNGNMAYVFKNVAAAITEDIATCHRNILTQTN